ncbi:hypothetical protein AMTR_s00111p00013280 [Amborella trichopoda]|uniref:Uncharacterized protein n=1 Tax=Amborella trichopoda TaxID=13333 RepID=W1NXY3_AMBTC|nr:hypothetical protein AMTR_s00111p00013280 [Amborella trichopoda]
MGALAMASTQLDLSVLIPNLPFKTAISNWCDEWGLKKPSPPDPKTAKELVHLQRSPKNGTKDETKVAEEEKPSPRFRTRYTTEEKPGFDHEPRVGIQEKPSLKDEIRAKTDETLCPSMKMVLERR